MRKFLLLCFLVFGVSFSGMTQTPADTSRKIIQFSGLAVDADSLTPLPYVAIVIRHSERGVYSNLQGYYSIVVQENDTVDFFALGYHQATFVMADTFTTNQYVHVQALRSDTIYLRETVIYPWPTKEQFKNAFLTANVPDDQLARAYATLDPRVMAQLAASVPNDAGMAYTSSSQQRVNANYYAGQKPPNNLLNPIAWSRFIQSIQNGDLKGH
jgi:hypothetical protein